MAFVKVTPAMAAEAVRTIDWTRIDAMTDEDIARQVADDPDVASIMSDAELVSAMVKTTRRRLRLSQSGFATRYHIPVGTPRDWEQGRKQPDPTAFTYLRVIAREPERVANALRPPDPRRDDVAAAE